MEVMMRLPASSLDILRTHFHEFGTGDGLSCDEFVRAMITYLPQSKTEQDKIALVMELVELFTQIDVNGDATLEWDEFTSYCIEAGMLATRKLEKPLGVEFKRATWFHSELKHHVIIELKAIPKHNVALLVEENSCNVKFFNLTTLKIDRVVKVYENDEDFTPIVGVDYAWDLHLLVVFNANMTMSFFSWDDLRPMGRTKTRSIRKLFYSSRAVMYTTDDSGLILLWQLRIKKINGMNQCICVPRGNMAAHTATLTCFSEIKRYDTLATGGMDAKIVLWNTEENTYVTTLTKHKRAVSVLEYSESHDMLLSMGYENDIFGWDVYNQIIVLTLSGHHAPCVGVQFTFLHAEDPEEYAVSCDLTGVMKLWSLRKTRTGERIAKQTFVADENGLYKPRKLLSCGPLKILTASRELRLFESVSTYVQQHIPSIVLFNKVLDRFFVTTGAYMQVWCAITGEIMDEWYHIAESEITAMVFDERERKVIIGTAQGKVNVLNASNGALMKSAILREVGSGGYVARKNVNAATLDPAVVTLHYNKNDKCLIAFTSYSVYVFDEDIVIETLDGVTMPVFRLAHDLHEPLITMSTFSYNLSLIATGASDSVRVWDFQHLRLEGELIGHNGEISAMTFVEGYPLLVTTDVESVILIWSVRPHPHPYACLTQSISRSPVDQPVEGKGILCLIPERQNARKGSIMERKKIARTAFDIWGKNHLIPMNTADFPTQFYIKTMAVVQVGTTDKSGNTIKKRLLVTGDKRGDLKYWDLHRLLVELNLEPLDMSRSPPTVEGYNAKRHVELSYLYLFTDPEEEEDEDIDTSVGAADVYKEVSLDFSKPTVGREMEVERRQKLIEKKNRMKKQQEVRKKLKLSRETTRKLFKPMTKIVLHQEAIFYSHDEEINMIDYLDELGIIASCSIDGNVRLWSFEGVRVGNLTVSETEDKGVQTGKLSSTRYQIKINVEAKIAARKRFAVETLERVGSLGEWTPCVAKEEGTRIFEDDEEERRSTSFKRGSLKQRSKSKKELRVKVNKALEHLNKTYDINMDPSGETTCVQPPASPGGLTLPLLPNADTTVVVSPLRNTYNSLQKKPVAERSRFNPKTDIVDITPSELLLSIMPQNVPPLGTSKSTNSTDIVQYDEKTKQELVNCISLPLIKRGIEPTVAPKKRERKPARDDNHVPVYKRPLPVRVLGPLGGREKTRLHKRGSQFVRDIRHKVVLASNNLEKSLGSQYRPNKGLTAAARRRLTTKIELLQENQEDEEPKVELVKKPRKGVLAALAEAKGPVKELSKATKLSLDRRRRQGNSRRLQRQKKNEYSKQNIGIYSKKEILDLKLSFDQIDEDGGGTIDLEELMDNLDKLATSLDLDKLGAFFEVLDDDHSGEIAFIELLSIFMPAASKQDLKEMELFVEEATHQVVEERQIRPLTETERKEFKELFHIYDTDGGGSLSLMELFEALNKVPYKPKDQFEEQDELLFSFDDLERICEKYGVTMEHELGEDDFVNLMHEFLSMDVEII